MDVVALVEQLSVLSPPLSAWIPVGSPNSLTDARNNCRTVSARLLLEYMIRRL